MGGKVSAKTQQRLDILTQGRRKIDRLHSLVEQYASGTKGGDTYASMITRGATDVGRVLLNNGFGVMADHANQMATMARRGGATQSKFRGLRELVGHLKGELDRAEKSVIAEDAAEEGGAEG